MWNEVPLWKTMKDPLRDEQVRKDEDCSYDMTVISVFSQDRFVMEIWEAVEMCVRDRSQPSEFQEGTFINAICQSGNHRASTFGKTLVTVLNAMLDGDGNRMFNACWFPTHRITKPDPALKAYESAKRWVLSPWETADAGPGVISSRSKYWGYNQCMQREAAMTNWHKIFDIATYYGPVHDALEAEDDTAAAENTILEPTPKPKLRPVPPSTAPPANLYGPVPPSTAPPESLRPSSSSIKRSHDDADPPVAQPRTVKPRVVPPRVVPPPDRAREDRVVPQSSQGRAVPKSAVVGVNAYVRQSQIPVPSSSDVEEDLPSWATLATDSDMARAWHSELVSLNVDDAAMKELSPYCGGAILGVHIFRYHVTKVWPIGIIG